MAIPGSGLLNGFATTFRNLFAPKVTRQYPEVRPTIPDRWRGRLDLIYDPFGEHKCEVCFQCAQVCPVEAIDMSGFDSEGNRIRYGMPEIYDERVDPNAYRRAGLAARPMRNAARWDDEVDSAFVRQLVEGYDARPEALVAIFGAVQARYRYLPERALRLISDLMTIHWAQVFGAAGLGGFRLLPSEGHLITVCSCAACRFSGGDTLLAALREDLGIDPGESTSDGGFTLETSPDVGAGAISPALRIDTLVYGPLTPDEARHLVHQRREAAAGTPALAAGSTS
ncbi:MAG: NAD(P)H-dependent oxidoreductase subunit E [Chloroflexota bacterium]|nr:NAD(P)H-dependent oxidoreductase subunit E [Chloroflexota bacterium]